MGSTRTHRGRCCSPNQWMEPMSLGSIGAQRFLQMSLNLSGVSRSSHASHVMTEDSCGQPKPRKTRGLPQGSRSFLDCLWTAGRNL
uniref:Uncharacterized protein n=1 Tax=Arundo donax TaxID=35708 RepID=A0A0A9G7H6_ARUDO